MPTAAPTEVQEYDGLPLSIWDVSAALAADIAAGLTDRESILYQYSMTAEQWELLKATPMFRAMLKEKMRELRGLQGASGRIKMRAAIACEDSVAQLYDIAHDRAISAATRVSAISLMSKLAGVDKPDDIGGGGGGPSFMVNINIGGNQHEVATASNLRTIEGQAEPA